MSQQPAFFVSNPNRRDEFNVQTFINSSGNSNGFTVEKRPATFAAKKHVQSMAKHYKKLSKIKFRTADINIVAAHSSKDGVLFDYVEGKSAERRVIELLLDGKSEEALTVIDRVLSIFNDLPSVQATPTTSEDYTAVFGNTYAKNQLCLKLGIIDINLDNIQITPKGSYHLFDYEWVFDFPIAKNHAIQRLLWWFIARHQQIFKYHSLKLECLEIAENFFVPEIIYKKYKHHINNFSELIEAENNFQSYTRPSAKPKLLTFYSIPKKPDLGETNLLRIKNSEKQLVNGVIGIRKSGWRSSVNKIINRTIRNN